MSTPLECPAPQADPATGVEAFWRTWADLKGATTMCPDVSFKITDWYVIIGTIGGGLWVLAYVVMVHKSWKDKRYGIPVTAIGLNIAWEFMTAFLLYDPLTLWVWFERLWVFIDVGILAQAIYYGKKEQYNSTFSGYWYLIVPAYVLAAFVGQYTFVVQFHDNMAFILGFLINLVMSGTFLLLLGSRLDHNLGTAGLSLPGAYLKMFGTMGTSIMCFFLLPQMDGLSSIPFLYFLWIANTFLDALYVVLLTRAQRATSRTSP